MKKVKVNRYISGKRPEYAPKNDSEEDDDIFENRKSIIINKIRDLPNEDEEER